MDSGTFGGWVYIKTDRYRGTLYVGVTSDIATQVSQHREDIGSDFCKRYGLHRLVWAERFDTIDEAITFEKRIKRWRRQWKFELIEKTNPEWEDLFETLV